MADLTEFYRILGIDPASDPELITAARDELIRVWNPDRFQNDDRIRLMAVVKIAEINAAHDVLIAHSQNGRGILSRVDSRALLTPDVEALQQNSLKKRAYIVLLAVISSVIWFWLASHHEQETTPPMTGGASAIIKRVPQPVNELNLAYFILDMVERLDLSKISPRSIPDVQGQSSICDPKMMTALLFYSYCTGVPSSRQIEKKTYEDPIFKIISANSHPSHFSISEFRNRHTAALGEIFVQMLQLCRKAGFAHLGNVAVETGLLQYKETASGMEKMKNEEIEKQVRALLAKADEVDREADKK